VKAADTVSDPDRWLLTPSDYALVMAKHQASRLAFAVLLVFFRTRGRFPRNTSEIDPTTVEMLWRRRGTGTIVAG